MINALLFDLDNTLYSEKTGMEIHVLERINHFVAEYLGLPRHEAVLVRREGARRFGTTLEWMMAEKGFRDPDAYFSAIHPEGEEDCIPFDPELGKLLDAFPQKKYILTNSPLEHTSRVLGKLGITDRFSGIYDIRFNGLVGKPHPEAYLRVLASAGLELGSTLFIDDLPKYVKGFTALGGRALLKDEGDRFADSGCERIHSLKELKAFLD